MTSPPRPRPAAAPTAEAMPERASPFPGWATLVVQLVLIGGAALAYFAVRGLTQGSLETALGNAQAIVSLQRALGLDREGWLQGLIVDHHVLVMLANWVYIYGHWPVIVAALTLLFVRFPDRFYELRNALFISGAIGLVVFALVPVAPPRLGVLDLADTVTERSRSYRALQPPGLLNRYAALPSLHFGWNLLMGIVLWDMGRRPLVRAFAVAMPAAMAFAVVATANHYVIDVVAGGLVALTGLVLARRLPAVRPTPEWARPRR
jgi:hypothetical protein